MNFFAILSTFHYLRTLCGASGYELGKIIEISSKLAKKFQALLIQNSRLVTVHPYYAIADGLRLATCFANRLVQSAEAIALADCRNILYLSRLKGKGVLEVNIYLCRAHSLFSKRFGYFAAFDFAKYLTFMGKQDIAFA